MFSARGPLLRQPGDDLSLTDASNNASANVPDPFVDPYTLCLQQIVSEHAHELTIRRKQLTIPLNNGVIDDALWRREVDFFIHQVIEPQAGHIMDSMERHKQVRQIIEATTARYSSSRVCFSLNRDPLPFEHLVADALSDLGWTTCFVTGEGDRGIDVIAEMRETRVVIQCRYSSSSLRHTTVLGASVGKAFDTDYVAIVTNADFTSMARRYAVGTRVILLHHDELTQLEERIFGTDMWRQKIPDSSNGARK